MVSGTSMILAAMYTNLNVTRAAHLDVNPAMQGWIIVFLLAALALSGLALWLEAQPPSRQNATGATVRGLKRHYAGPRSRRY